MSRATQNIQLRLTLEAPSRVRQGVPVPLVFTVTNTGKTPVTLQLTGRTPTADFRVTDLHGRSIWSRLRGQIMLGALRLFPLDAGKSLSFRQAWDQRTDSGGRAPPGEYQVVGVLLTDDPNGLVSPSMRLRIEG